MCVFKRLWSVSSSRWTKYTLKLSKFVWRNLLQLLKLLNQLTLCSNSEFSNSERGVKVRISEGLLKYD